MIEIGVLSSRITRETHITVRLHIEVSVPGRIVNVEQAILNYEVGSREELPIFRT